MSALDITTQDVDAWHTQMCQALRFGSMLDNFPSMVRRCLALRTWEKRECRDKGRPFRNAREYFTHNEPDGVGTTPKVVEKLIERDPVLLKDWRKAVTGQHGGDRVSEEAESKNDNVMLARQGNSKAYTLDLLSRKAPGLFEAVRRGEMSANKAAIEAGLRKKPTPFEQVRRLLPRLTDEQTRQLIGELQARLGAPPKGSLK